MLMFFGYDIEPNALSLFPLAIAGRLKGSNRRDIQYFTLFIQLEPHRREEGSDSDTSEQAKKITPRCHS